MWTGLLLFYHSASKPANKKSSPKQDLTQEKFAKGRQRKKATQKGHHKALYTSLLTSGKLNSYLADIDRQAEEMFSLLINQLSEKEGVTEALKAEHLMLWVQKMNSIRNTAMEVVSNDLIYA